VVWMFILYGFVCTRFSKPREALKNEFLKPVEKITFLLKCGKNNGTSHDDVEFFLE
jgi:hypothetical protein